MNKKLDEVDLPFVVLRHELPADSPHCTHWDLMFATRRAEAEDKVLETWSCEHDPCDRLFVSGGRVAGLKRLPNHRGRYIAYEGPISQGRGDVYRVLSGRITHRRLGDRECVFRLATEQLHGQLTLVCDAQHRDVWHATWLRLND